MNIHSDETLHEVGYASATTAAEATTPLADLSSRIKNYHLRAVCLAKSSIEMALKCGQALIEAKAQVPHGSWIPWLRGNCPEITDRQSQKYMRLAEHWPQIEALCQTHPTEVTSVNGALGLIAISVSKISNTNSGSYLESDADVPPVHRDSCAPDAPLGSTVGQESVEDSIEIPHSDSVAVPDAAPASRQVGSSCESLPTEPEPPQAKLLVDQADSMARHTIPGIIEAGKSLDEFLVQRGRTGVDIEKVKSLSQELTGIFQRAKGEISRCR